MVSDMSLHLFQVQPAMSLDAGSAAPRNPFMHAFSEDTVREADVPKLNNEPFVHALSLDNVGEADDPKLYRQKSGPVVQALSLDNVGDVPK